MGDGFKADGRVKIGGATKAVGCAQHLGLLHSCSKSQGSKAQAAIFWYSGQRLKLSILVCCIEPHSGKAGVIPVGSLDDGGQILSRAGPALHEQPAINIIIGVIPVIETFLETVIDLLGVVFLFQGNGRKARGWLEVEEGLAIGEYPHRLAVHPLITSA